jgi:hypothetical protein
MSTKRIFLCALVLAVLGLGTAHAQEKLPSPELLSPPTQVAPPPGPPLTPAETPPLAPGAAPIPNWLTYTRPDCCGPIGANGPIHMELFVRSGPSFPVEGSIFQHVLQTGWDIEGGGRSLFFNPQMDAAWAIDLSLSYIYNHGQHSDRAITFLQDNSSGAPVNPTLVTIKDLNRTFANVGLGREWYLWRAGHDCNDLRWNWGIDGGGRLGTVKLDLNEIQHRTDVAGAMFVALHTDLEVPCGCCTFLAGLRLEWDYTWMDILQHQNDSDLMDVNLLITLGIRF